MLVPIYVLNIHSQVDVIFLDFAKTFDSEPHVRLLLKALSLWHSWEVK